MLGRIRHFLCETQGAIGPLVAISLVILIGVGGLAWDVSRAYAARAELEAAVDAAALAGATQLDGTAGAQTRATAAAQGALSKNSQFLADAATGDRANVAIASADITFLQNLTTRATATNDANANFIQINLTPRTLGVVTGALVRSFSFNVTAHAVAGYGSAVCMAPPMFVCNPDESQTIDLFDAHAGKGIVMNGKGGSSAFGPGEFGYLQVGDFKLHTIEKAMGRSPPASECFGDAVYLRTGDPTTPLDWLNTRFDIYDNVSDKDEDPKTSPNYAPAEITITGLDKTTGSKGVCKPDRTGDEFDGQNGASIPAIPLPRDECAYSTYSGTKCMGGAYALGNGKWDRTNYFRINHGWTGLISDTTAPITGDSWSSFYDYPGVSPKPTYPTRYQTYLWEKARKGNGSLWPTSTPPAGNIGAAANSPSGNADYALKQCSSQSAVTGVPDRRSITLVVLNCSLIKDAKKDPQAVVGAVDIFLTEPARLDGNGLVLGEIIGSSSDTSAVGKETRLYSVRLYE